MVIKEMNEKQRANNTIDLLVTLIVGELSEDLKINPDEMFSKFVSSRTEALLYDEESKLWWNGPSYIADIYKEEMEKSGV